MKVRFSRLAFVGSGTGSVAIVMCASNAIAQSSDTGAAPVAALGGVMLLFVVVLGLAAYVYMSLALSTIATKTGTPNPWLA